VHRDLDGVDLAAERSRHVVPADGLEGLDDLRLVDRDGKGGGEGDKERAIRHIIDLLAHGFLHWKGGVAHRGRG